MYPTSTDSQLAEVRSDIRSVETMAEVRHHEPEDCPAYGRYRAYEAAINEIKERYKRAKDQVAKMDDPMARETTLKALEGKETDELYLVRNMYNRSKEYHRLTPWQDICPYINRRQLQRLEELAAPIKDLNAHLRADAAELLAQRDQIRKEMSEIRLAVRKEEKTVAQAKEEYEELIKVMGDIGHQLGEMEKAVEKERNQYIQKFKGYAITIPSRKHVIDVKFINQTVQTLYHKVTGEFFVAFDMNRKEDTYAFEFDDRIDTANILEMYCKDLEDGSVSYIGEKKVTNPDEIHGGLYRFPPELEIDPILECRGKQADDEDPTRESFIDIHGHVMIEGKLYFLVLWRVTPKNPAEYYQWLEADSFPFDEQNATGTWIEKSVDRHHPLYMFAYTLWDKIKEDQKEGYVFAVSRTALIGELPIPNVYAPDEQTGMSVCIAHFSKSEALTEAAQEGQLERHNPTHTGLEMWKELDKIRKEDPEGLKGTCIDTRLTKSELQRIAVANGDDPNDAGYQNGEPAPEDPYYLIVKHNPRKRTPARQPVVDEEHNDELEDEVMEIAAGTAARPSPTGRKGPATGGKRPGKSIQLH